MNTKPLPRSGGQAVVTMSGALWDRLCDMVESRQISVAYPLQLTETPGGMVISIVPDLIIPRVTVVSNATQPGVYKGYRRRPVKQKYDPTRTGLLNADSISDFGEVPEHQDEIYIMNGAEEGTNTHALTDPDGYISKTHLASPLEVGSMDNKPVYFINGTAGGGCTPP